VIVANTLVGLMAGIQVLVIGDSITAGVVSGPAGSPYVEVLAEELGGGYEVINAGCSGAASLDWLRPLAVGLPCPIAGAYELRAAPYLPADIVLVELGGNDAMGFFELGPTPIETYASVMATLVDRLLDDGAGRVVLMTPPPNIAAGEVVGARLRAYGDALWLLCEGRTNVECFDLYALLDPRHDFYAFNCHPNAAGHEKIGLALADAVRIPVPEPWTFVLLAAGLIGLAWLSKGTNT
jgi:lysophospholipase L1-like esterase